MADSSLVVAQLILNAVRQPAEKMCTVLAPPSPLPRSTPSFLCYNTYALRRVWGQDAKTWRRLEPSHVREIQQPRVRTFTELPVTARLRGFSLGLPLAVPMRVRPLLPRHHHGRIWRERAAKTCISRGMKGREEGEMRDCPVRPSFCLPACLYVFFARLRSVRLSVKLRVSVSVCRIGVRAFVTASASVYVSVAGNRSPTA